MTKNITKPGMKTVAKTIVFDPDSWSEFEDRTRQLGISTSSFFRKVVNDYLANRYVHLDTVRAGVVDEMVKRQEELRLTTLQPVIDMVLADWLEQRSRKK